MSFEGILESIESQGGVTLSCASQSNVNEVMDDRWYFPLLPDATEVVLADDLHYRLDEFMLCHQKRLKETNVYLGVWLNPENDSYYLDINTAERSKPKAIQRAKSINSTSKRQILAMYNPQRDETINI